MACCCPSTVSPFRRTPYWITVLRLDLETGELVWKHQWYERSVGDVDIDYEIFGTEEVGTRELRHLFTAGFLNGDEFATFRSHQLNRRLDAATGVITVSEEEADVPETMVRPCLVQRHDGVYLIEPFPGSVLDTGDTMVAKLDDAAETTQWSIDYDDEYAFRIRWIHGDRAAALRTSSGYSIGLYDSGTLQWAITSDDPPDFSGTAAEEDWWEMVRVCTDVWGGYDPPSGDIGDYDSENPQIAFSQDPTIHAVAVDGDSLVSIWTVAWRLANEEYPELSDGSWLVYVIARHDNDTGEITESAAFPYPPDGDCFLGADDPPEVPYDPGEQYVAPPIAFVPSNTGELLAWYYTASRRFLCRVSGVSLELLCEFCPFDPTYVLMTGDGEGYLLGRGSSGSEVNVVSRFSGGAVDWTADTPRGVLVRTGLDDSDLATQLLAATVSGDDAILVYGRSREERKDIYTYRYYSVLRVTPEGETVWQTPLQVSDAGVWGGPDSSDGSLLTWAGTTTDPLALQWAYSDESGVYLNWPQRGLRHVLPPAGTPATLVMREDCVPDEPEEYYYTYGTCVQDSFFEASDVSLAAHVSDSGHGWVLVGVATPWANEGVYAGSSQWYVEHPGGESAASVYALIESSVPGAEVHDMTWTPLSGPGQPARVGLLFRCDADVNNGWLAVIDTAISGVVTAKLLSRTSGGAWVEEASGSFASSGSALRLHDDGEWIGLDIDGTRILTLESDMHASNTRVGLHVLISINALTIDSYRVCTRSGCEGDDEWRWVADVEFPRWGAMTGSCPDPCTSLPPIGPGEIDGETRPGRCGNWTA